MTHEKFMREAIRLSDEAIETNCGGPFGAVIVKENKIIGRGFNQVLKTNDPTAHAEINAIRQASQCIDSYDLSGCVTYTNCEPCPMCLSAIMWARVDKIYYALTCRDATDIGFDDAYFFEQMTLHPDNRDIPSSHLLRDEGMVVFEKWVKSSDKKLY